MSPGDTGDTILHRLRQSPQVAPADPHAVRLARGRAGNGDPRMAARQGIIAKGHTARPQRCAQSAAARRQGGARAAHAALHAHAAARDARAVRGVGRRPRKRAAT